MRLAWDGAGLGRHGLRLLRPVDVEVDSTWPGGVVASWDAAGARGHGATEAEALDDLADDVASLVADLAAAPAGTLGRLPAAWAATLGAAVA